MPIGYIKQLSERFLPFPWSIVVNIAEAFCKDSQLKLGETMKRTPLGNT